MIHPSCCHFHSFGLPGCASGVSLDAWGARVSGGMKDLPQDTSGEEILGVWKTCMEDLWTGLSSFHQFSNFSF
jgi:hypothetical protein